MTDKTLGAYKRTAPDPDDMDGGVTAAAIEKEAEKTTAADFAKAEFARHPRRGASAYRIHPTSRFPWAICYGPTGDTMSLQEHATDTHMSEQGWSPVRECPDPEQHGDGLSDAVRALTEAVNNLSERAKKAEENATYWENTSRAQTGALQRAQDREEKARRERAKTLADLDDLSRRYNEQGDALVASYAQPRPLTPDDITDEAHSRARGALREFIADGGQVESSEGARSRAVDIVLSAALTVPTRPEGAEFWDSVIADQVAGDLSPEAIRTLADTIAKKVERDA